MTLRPYLIGAIAGAALTLALLWALEPDPVPEPAAPSITLPSGAVVAERVPDAPLPPVAAEAARELGGETVRAGRVTIQPRAAANGVGESGHTAGSDAGDVGSNPTAGSRPPSSCLCRPDPITIDWSLTRVDDGHRMSWWADGGTITEAVDIPVSPVLTRAQPKWAAGLSVSIDMSQRRAFGAWVDRDLGRVRLGLEISQRDGGTATLRAGIRF